MIQQHLSRTAATSRSERPARLTAIALALGTATLVALSSGPPAAAQITPPAPPASPGAWLDGPLQNWNEPGGFVPAAPFSGSMSDARCRGQERRPAGPEEAQVGNAGWTLITAWPTQRQSDVAVVTATGDYDGMCRPIGYNAFVFTAGVFAGTVSPVPMGSRSDGALVRPPAILPGGRVDASFVRFAPSDPLCCPSRPQTRLLFRIDREGPAARPVLVPERPAAPAPGAGAAGGGAAPGRAVVPRLPATGGAYPDE